ncbi:hypothetical protein [Tenacibaculum sp. 190524A02b]|uniref:Uncharacterized protein n=1 Tax=Tenacibaculum vairaonense TaxID=3137860 RepID=A0ABP1FCF3_9FLAO
MKRIKNTLPFILALVPQLLFEKYIYVLIITIIIGFIGAWIQEDKKIFSKMLIIQLIFFSIIFYFTKDNISYLNNVAENLKLPAFLITIIFILFNTLNISILFLFGYRFQKLVFNNTPSKSYIN